jgi:2-keto-4-pentenoate hydratase
VISGSNKRLTALADSLFVAWKTGGRAPLPEPEAAPRDLDEATRVQDLLVERLGFPVVGWKVGLSSKGGQAAHGFDRPFMGRLFAQNVAQSPARFPAEIFRQPLMETEIGFRMVRDMPPRAAPYRQEEVLDAVGEAFIGVELADIRYAAPWPFPIPLLTADNGAAAAYVVGALIPDWRTVDFDAIETALDYNGKRVAGNLTGDMRTPPVPILVWAANDLSRRGIGLKAGDIVSTGSACTPTFFSPGTETTAHFAGLEPIRISIDAGAMP